MTVSEGELIALADELEKANAHYEKIVALIAVAESGDAKRAAYEQIADEIAAWQADDPALTQRAVADQIGKSDDWVSRLLLWRKAADPDRQLPFARDPDNDFRARHEARKVPTRHSDRVEMAETLLSDRQVVASVLSKPSTARAVVTHAVHDQGAVEREATRAFNRARRASQAMPLPAYMSRMVVKMNEWALGLAALVDDLDELPDGRGRELVLEAALDLRTEADRWVERLSRPGLVEVLSSSASRR